MGRPKGIVKYAQILAFLAQDSNHVILEKDLDKLLKLLPLSLLKIAKIIMGLDKFPNKKDKESADEFIKWAKQLNNL